MLFFASPIGLGHATRDIAIAEKLHGEEILFISGEGASRLIEKKGYRVLDAYRPEKFIVQDGQLQQSFKWLMSYYSYYKKCKEIAKGVLAEHEGLVVSDEDFASIAVAEGARRRRVLITDITETHFTRGAASLIEKKMNGAMRDMMKKCDCVIIPDDGDDNGNVSYVGPIVRKATADRDTLRRRFNFSRKTIVVSVGGTDAGRYLIERSLAAYRKLRDKLDADLVVVPGPSLQVPESPDYRNLGFVDNLHELIYAADLVVSLAGRSTMDESIAYGTPGIFIPIKGHFEQEQGAARLGYKHEDIFRLESLIEEKLGRGGRNNNTMNTGGAEKAAKIISTLFV
ncbi:glycosyltransferase [Nitrososphaera viennensis]|uniref:UDP-glucuronosyltransferase n=1 Tax=Nitrososphaera viennensis TaxID=1034015 RepID=A0A977IC72_9ARCH|nr:glycosyltransferase [Nitrososphaera viennensis]UVS68304.1 UDP-glucuronosyltransferase [Nitrososphaera viennensis]